MYVQCSVGAIRFSNDIIHEFLVSAYIVMFVMYMHGICSLQSRTVAVTMCICCANHGGSLCNRNFSVRVFYAGVQRGG